MRPPALFRPRAEAAWASRQTDLRRFPARSAHFPHAPRILVFGAGFGGLELCSILSQNLGADVEVTPIDRADAFTFG